ncbi:hypothetical protein N9893_01120 [bacterium]|nr:hypothetical protein [bacterium]
MLRISWQASSGTGGRLPPESVAGITGIGTQYQFKVSELRMFLKALLTEAEKNISGLELPSSFDVE